LRLSVGHEKRQAEACLLRATRTAYFEAEAAAAAGAEAEADAEAAAGFIFFIFFAFGAEADAEADAAAGVLAMAVAEAEADADGLAKATVANREMNRAAIVLDMLFPFMVRNHDSLESSP
jgi:hypothetical protein